MRVLKTLTVVSLVFCLLMLSSYLTLADADWSARLVLKQTSEVDSDNMLTIRASVSDISSKDGIICAIYHVTYDPAVLELVSWENAYPSAWDFSGNTSFGAEDWTSVLEDDNGNSYLMYTVMNTSLEQGVKEDGVLYTDLVFKKISSKATSTEITVSNISFMDKDLENNIEIADVSLNVDLHVEESSSVVESSEESSQATSSEQEESSEPEESSAVEESSKQESSVSEEESSEEESEETSDPVSVEESTVEPQMSDATVESETARKRVTMTVLLKDIKDEYGVSALEFKLKYKPSLLKFVDYEIILPDNWDLNTEYTEDLCSVGTNGDLMFCVMNYQVGCGVKEDNVLGFRIEFEVDHVSFDPSLITMEEILLINDNLEDVSEENYQLSISFADENGSIADDTFSSSQNEGKTIKIVIAVISCAVVLALAVVSVVLVRKKKQS